MKLVVDAGPLFAYLAADDDDHERCTLALETYRGELIVPQLVLAEVSYFINTRTKRLLGTKAAATTELALIEDITAGSFTVEPVRDADWPRITELIETYHGFPLGMTDASVIATAERLGTAQIATLDDRHFHAVKPAGFEYFDFVL